MINPEYKQEIEDDESEVCLLVSKVSDLESNNENLSQEVISLKAELAIKEEYIKALKQAIFGKSSEKSSAHEEQLSLSFDEAEEFADSSSEDLSCEDEDTEELTYTRKKKSKAGRKPIPENLPREDVIHDLSEDQKICDCGCELTRIGTDITEELDLIPAKILVRRHIRNKYACKSCEEKVKRAPAPFRPLGGVMASSGLIADMIVKKFEDHLPLYRQSKIWWRHGIELSRATLCNWVLKCGETFAPLAHLMKLDILASGYVCSDETVVNVLEEKNKHKNYMWLHMSGDRDKRAIIYTYDASRSTEAANKFLYGYQGFHQCDGYQGYYKLHDSTGVIGVGCMGHCRRKFMDIVKITTKKGVAHKVIKIVRRLYKIEDEIADLSFSEKKDVRQAKSKPIMEELYTLLIEYQPRTPPQGMLGKAINYALNQWEKLTAYLEDGRLRIDNNDAERSIRPFAVGRKNWMFFNTQKGAVAGCVIFSLIETCKANGINTFDYFKYILENIHKAENEQQLRQMLPYNLDPQLLKA